MLQKVFKRISIIIVLVIAFLISLISCKPVVTHEYVKYSVKKGKNKFKPRGITKASDIIEFYFYLDSSLLYNLDEVQGQTFISKITGLSDCNKHHHESAMYLGFQPVFGRNGQHLGRFKVYKYSRKGGEFNFKEIDEVYPGEVNFCKIQRTKDMFYLFYKDMAFMMPKEKTAEVCITSYLIYPYFGGNPPAPHDMNLFIRFK